MKINIHALLIKVFIVILFLMMTSCTVLHKNVKIITSKSFDKNRSQIAIMSFANSGNKYGYDSYISDKLSYTLIEKNFKIVERERIHNVISELKLEASGLMSKSDLSKFGKLANVDIICTGTVYYQSTRGNVWPYTIMVRFVDVRSSEVVFVAECTNEEDWSGSNCVRNISEELELVAK